MDFDHNDIMKDNMNSLMEDLMSEVFDDTPKDIFGSILNDIMMHQAGGGHGHGHNGVGALGGHHTIKITMIQPLNSLTHTEVSDLVKNDPCGLAMRRFCSGIDDIYEATQCLLGHKEDISGGCKHIIDESVFGKCEMDIQSYCPYVKPGHNHIHICLAEQLTSEAVAEGDNVLTDDCKGYLHGGHMLAQDMAMKTFAPVPLISENINSIQENAKGATPLSPAPTDSSSEGETALRAEPTRKDIEVEKVSNGLKLSDKVVWGSIIGCVGVFALMAMGVATWRRYHNKNELFEDYRLMML